jgi:hypothetical protein
MGEVGERRNVGIVVQPPDAAMRRIGKTCCSLQSGTGGNELPKKEAASSLQAVTVQLRRGVVSRITDFLDLLPKCESQPVFGSYVMKRPLAPYQRGQALGTIEPLS